MRKIFVITIICVITLLGANFLVKELVLGKLNTTEPGGVVGSTEIAVPDDIQEEMKKLPKEEFNSTDIKNKISLLRNRYAIKGLIQKGDTYLENYQLLLALRSYLEAKKETPNDKKIIKKIADTYYEMRKYSIAYNHYKTLIGSKEVSPERIAISYIKSLSFDTEKNTNFGPIQKNISSLGLSPDDSFFYTSSLDCLINLSTCQKSFENYINQGKGTKNKKISYIKKAFQDYKNLQVQYPYFKDTYFISALFQSGLYPVSNVLASSVLEQKPGYLPIIKMLAKGHFELGKYEEAKKYLLLYNTIDKSDPKVNYMLGIVNIKLHSYILSNIYFLKALKLGYDDKANISRRLIYNYYLVEDNARMMQEFKNLIENMPDLTAIDYSLAIYYSLINSNTKQANKWVNTALKLYPKNDNFYGYKGWIFKEAGNISSALDYLENGLKINAHNPLINLNLGIIEGEKENFLKAKIYLKNTLKQDPNGDFGEAATMQLIELEEKQKSFQEELEGDILEYQ